MALVLFLDVAEYTEPYFLLLQPGSIPNVKKTRKVSFDYYFLR